MAQRPPRAAAIPRVVPQPGWHRAHWNAFAAPIYQAPPQAAPAAQFTNVTLHYTDAQGAAQVVAGATGEGDGHAEMNALGEFLRNRCGNTRAGFLQLIVANPVSINCTAKPCCFRCSVVLGVLGIQALTAATTKTQSSMGSTQWACTPDLRATLEIITNGALTALMCEELGEMRRY